MKVLIADDDALSRKILQDCLSEWGYDIVMANNGNEDWSLFGEIDRPKWQFLIGYAGDGWSRNMQEAT